MQEKCPIRVRCGDFCVAGTTTELSLVSAYGRRNFYFSSQVCFSIVFDSSCSFALSLQGNLGLLPVVAVNDPPRSNLTQTVGQQFSTNEHFTLPWLGSKLNTPRYHPGKELK